MKNELMFGVESLVAALVLVSCLTFFFIAVTSLGAGLLMLSTVMLAFPITHVRILWERANK